MNSEIDNTETMNTSKTKKTVKKKSTRKPLKGSMKKKGGSNPTPNTSKSEIVPPSQKMKVVVNKFEDLEGKFLLVRVGNDKRPAEDSDILDIESKLTKLLEDNDVKCLTFVTHHAVDIMLIEKTT